MLRFSIVMAHQTVLVIGQLGHVRGEITPKVPILEGKSHPASKASCVLSTSSRPQVSHQCTNGSVGEWVVPSVLLTPTIAVPTCSARVFMGRLLGGTQPEEQTPGLRVLT
jgi:hypothetical protein